MKFSDFIKKRACFLRSQGKTYKEIKEILGVDIPKSTLSFWLSDIRLTDKEKDRINDMIGKNREKARERAVEKNKETRRRYFQALFEKNNKVTKETRNKNVVKMILSALYLGEGGKSRKGAIMFGNSSPSMIKLFLKLLRDCYAVDEKKFRCTLQCRFDQEIKEMEEYWSNITKIPLEQFYKARVDLRTCGKPTKKLCHKGVCRIDYFSADVYNELNVVSEILLDS